MLCAGALGAMLAGFAPPAAGNSSVNVQLFRPSGHFGDQTHAVGSQLAPARSWGFGLTTSFGKNPLVFIDRDTHQRHEVVQEQATMDLFRSITPFDWLDLGVEIPIHLVNVGASDGFTGIHPFPSQVLGDMRIALKTQFVDPEETSLYGMAARVVLGLPTGHPYAFVSDGLSGEVTLIADVHGHGLRFTVNAGLRVQEGAPLPSAELTFQEVGPVTLLYAVGLSGYLLGDGEAWVPNETVHLNLELDLHGGTGAGDPFKEDLTALETLLGLNVQFPGSGVGLRLGGGTSWMSGHGNVEYRLYVGFSFFDLNVTEVRDNDR
jgi:hypothetical protein